MAPGYDIESGGMGTPVRGALRLFVARKSRLALTVAALLTVVLYLAVGESRPAVPPPPTVVAPINGDGRVPIDDIWNDLPPPVVVGPPGKAPPPPTRPPRPDDPRYYVIDENGDHFLTNVGRKIPPMHPGPKDSLDPSELFPNMTIEEHLQPPPAGDFPQSKIREIISEAPKTDDPPKVTIEADAFSQTWTPPDNWDKPGTPPKPVQWASFKLKDRDWESSEQRERREARLEAVKRGFVHAWQGYKTHAWGHDEVRPKSKTIGDPFNGWGASIIDTLDTLLVMGLQDEYNLCRPHVNQLNFHWIKGGDWSQGYIGLEDEVDKDGKRWQIGRDPASGMPVFESGIRYLGGLLGAYDLSGDQLMLDRAIEIGNILSRAFNTKSGLPQGSRFDPGAETGVYHLSGVSIAEVGSMSLEMMRLSYATGDRKWFDLVQRAMDYIENKVIPRSKFKPLIPMAFSPDATGPISGSYSFGAMADSYYEYLIKTYKLLNGNEIGKQWKRVYEESIDEARKVLFADIDIFGPDYNMMTIGKWEHGTLHHETEHLACFAGAMLSLGAKLLDRPQDMADAGRFTGTCYWIGAATKTGIQPEVVHFYHSDDEKRFENMTTEIGPNGEPRLWHPPITEPFHEDQVNYAKMRKTNKGEWLWSDDRSPVTNNSGRAKNRPITYYRSLIGQPAGTKRVTTYYINRPESIESVFYMWRLTGDRGWQDKGWRMFSSWMNHSTVAGGISSITDVTRDPERGIVYGDNMESFIFAETFKYHYLLQADPELLSLDDYVLNTEAHPFISDPKAHKPGFEGLWDASTVKDQELGARAEGTDVQKWARMEFLNRKRPNGKAPPQRQGGSGRGMGGGPPPPPPN